MTREEFMALPDGEVDALLNAHNISYDGLPGSLQTLLKGPWRTATYANLLRSAFADQLEYRGVFEISKHGKLKLDPLVLDGITYTQQYVSGLQEPLRAVRDCLIESDRLSYAVSLSQIHALLQYYIENVKDDN